nr:MAG TPA: hypothetical protein [Caudoviricetes sp.]
MENGNNRTKIAVGIIFPSIFNTSVFMLQI